MKRFGNLWKYVLDENRAIDAIREAVKFKKHQRQVQKLLLYDREDYEKDPSLYHVVNPEKARVYAQKCIRLLETHT